MTKKEFLDIDWNDAHVGYDIEVGKYRKIAYMTLSNKYPGCLCLIADNKDFPIRNSYCGIQKNLRPADILEYLKKDNCIEKVIAVIDGIVYDLLPEKLYVNGIDGEVLFDIIPYKQQKSQTVNNEIIDIEEKEI